MREVVGSSCILCRQSISSLFDGVFCLECGGSYHHQCLGKPPPDPALQPCHYCNGETDPRALAACIGRKLPLLPGLEQAPAVDAEATGGLLIHGLGTITWIVGILLYFGNRSGKFPTFPFAGYLTTSLGVLIHLCGNSIISGRHRRTVGQLKRLQIDPRYQAAVRLALEDANMASPLNRAVSYLMETGESLAEAKENLQLILAVYRPAPAPELSSYVFTQTTTDVGPEQRL